MGKTSIEWAEHSINPLRARDRTAVANVGHHCEKISPGCQNCYASRLQSRFNLPQFTGPSRREQVSLWLDEGKLAEVLRRKKPTRYFWCDMTDLFGDWVNNEQIHRCFATMALTPHHTHMVLTKRAERMHEYMTNPDTPGNVAQWMAGHAMIPAAYKDYVPPWPPPSAWLGVSVENQDWTRRIDLLCKTPAALRFLSVEPLLGPVDLGLFGTLPQVVTPGEYVMVHQRIHWVIAGGESGPGARPCDLAWLRSLVKQCQEAGVPCFVKQLGAQPTVDNGEEPPRRKDGRTRIALNTWLLQHPKGGDPAEWPLDLRVREFPHGQAQ